MKTILKVLGLSLLLLALAAMAFGQTETGQITGVVKDKTGAVVPNAKVTVIAVATNTTRTTTSSAAGLYTVPSLKPAVYKVIIEAAGFQKFERQVQVTVSSNMDVSAQLLVGTASTVVEVSETASNVAVNTENNTISETVGAIQLNELPTSPTRDPYALVGTSNNVVEDNSSGRGAGFSINGQRSSSTSILLDGAENVDTFKAGIGQKVPLDAVQEFSVLTSNFGAEYGRASGGVVNVVTKSGTNQFHGSAYEFNRISKLASNTYYNVVNDTPKGIFTRNNFGYSIGGPVIKNKLFFFDNLEWIRVRSSSPLGAAIIDPASYSALGASANAFMTQYGSKLAANVKTVASGPCNTAGNPGANLTCDKISYTVPTDAGGGAPQNTWDHVAKIDWTISPKTTLTFRYAGYHEVDLDGYVNSSPYVGYSTGETNYDQNYTVAVTHLISQNVVNTTKIVYNRLVNTQPLGSNPVAPTLYTASSLPNVPGLGQTLEFPGYSQTTPGNSIPFGGPQNLYQVFDDVSVTKGRHQVKVGGQFIQIRDNRIFGAYENAVEYLGTNYNTGMTGLLNGTLHQFQSAVNPQGKYPCVKDLTGATIVNAACTVTLPISKPSFGRNFQYNDMAFYGQDSWKVSSRFTLTGGLRWEYYGVQHNANTNLDSNFVMGPGATIFDRIRNGAVEQSKNGGVFWKPFYGGFGPRLGFAWDVFGNGKTGVHGGYSLGYERNFGNVTFNAIQNPPAYAVISLIAPTDIASMPVYTDNNGPLAGTGSKALPQVSQRAINQNMKPAYAETWNFGIEQSVFKDAIFNISYAGSHGVHGYDIANVNPTGGGGLYLGDSVHPSNRLNLGYTNMNFRSDAGFSRYNALLVGFKVNNLAKIGLNLSLNYSWAHSLDNISSTFSEGAEGAASGNYQLGYLDAFNSGLNFGNSDFDVRHRFGLNGNWQLPWGKNASSKLVRYVIGGWGLGGILNVRSGSMFSIYDCNNANDTSCPLYAPGVKLPTSGSPKNGVAGLFDYIDLPLAGTSVVNAANSLGFPNCTGLHHTGCTYTTDGSPYPERNQFVGPSFWNADMQFMKDLKITERFAAQFRAEMYNIFNHHNQYIYYYNLDVSGTNTIQTAKGAPSAPGSSNDENRRVQFGLRLTF